MPVFGQRRKAAEVPSTNPFIARQLAAAEPVEIEVKAEPDELLGDALSWVGPAIPLGSPTSRWPSFIHHSPVRSGYPADALAVVNLHGGAGGSTACSILGEIAYDCPALTIPVLPDGQTVDVLFVARTHGLGLERARQVAAEWSTGQWDHVGKIGLLLVADGPQIAKPLHRTGVHTARLFPRTWRLPWVEEWRISPRPTVTEQTPLRINLTRKEISKHYSRKVVPS